MGSCLKSQFKTQQHVLVADAWKSFLSVSARLFHGAQDVVQYDGSWRGLRVIGFESKCKFMSTFSQVFLLLSNNLGKREYKQTATHDSSINNIHAYTEIQLNYWLQSRVQLMRPRNCIYNMFFFGSEFFDVMQRKCCYANVGAVT